MPTSTLTPPLLSPATPTLTTQQDCKSPDVKLSNDPENKHGHLVFKGKGEGADPEAHDYGLDLEFFAAIDVEGSKVATSDRGVVLIVAKADKDAEEHWPRLLKAAGKTPANIVSLPFPLFSLFFERVRRGEREPKKMTIFFSRSSLTNSLFSSSRSFSKWKHFFLNAKQKVDWDRWQDEDDEAEAAAQGGFGTGGDDGGFGGMDFSSLMQGGGMGGAGGGGAGGFDLSALQNMGGFGGGEEGDDDDFGDEEGGEEGGDGDDGDDDKEEGDEEGGEEAGSDEPAAAAAGTAGKGDSAAVEAAAKVAASEK